MARATHETDVIVIGGGVAGLAAARELARAGLKVHLLEARAHLGGRIDTRRPAGWKQAVELGAEFIHVGNPALWRVVRSARLKVRRLPDFHWLSRSGTMKEIPDLDERIAQVTRLIKPRQAGRLSFGDYFRRHPASVSPDNWMLARSFVEGFEAAPQDRISARSLAGEEMDEQHQYVLPGGYDQVVASLARDCVGHRVALSTSAVVQSVQWQRGRAVASTRGARRARGKTYSARAVVVTLPVGVLQARTGLGAVRFDPPLKRQQAWIDRLQMGDVVRLVVRFEPEAWRRLAAKVAPASRQKGGLGFIHSDVPGMPVWWSLSNRPILVGWAGGPAARTLLKLPPAARRARALKSLAEILQVSLPELRKAVVGWQAADWTNDPFARGAYSFTVAGEDATAAKLRVPVQGTLYFAGEALADGAEIGTVHGALGSGIRAAHAVIRQMGPSRRRRE